MKRCIGIFSIFVILLVLQLNSAAAQCATEDDVIFRLSSQTNAHGELHTGNYPEEICFSDFFGNEQIPTNRNCDGENTVVRLSSATNAHAEKPNGVTQGYQNVCYGALHCGLRTDSCNEGEVEILRLSGATNAHLELLNQGNYHRPLCCSLDEIVIDDPEITVAEWQSSTGSRISVSYVDRTVRLYAQAVEAEGEVVVFDAWEVDGIGNDDIPLEFDNAQITNGEAFVSLDITEDLIESLDDGNDCNNGLEFKFSATLGDSSMESQTLRVECSEGPNQPPVAVIKAPKHRQMYFVNTDVTFDHASTDPDQDDLEFFWEILDSDGNVEHTTQEERFEFSFDSIGERIVTLVVDDGQFQAVDRVAILVVGSPGIFAYINKPDYSSVVENVDGNKRVDFSGTDGYVINIIGDSCSTYQGECLGGFCPEETYNPAEGCSDNVSISNAPNDVSEADYSDIEFSWEFRDEHQVITLATASDFPEGWIAFNKESNAFNDKKGELTLAYDDGTIDVEQDVDTEFTLGRCLNNGKSYLWQNGVVESTSNANVCQGVDGLLESEGGSLPDCCPSNEFCGRNDNDDFVCMVAPINACADYGTESECEADVYNIADDDPAAPDSCENPKDQLRSVECYWDSQQNSCGIRAVCSPSSGGPGDTQCQRLSCNYLYDQSQCTNGYMEITYILGEYEPYDPGVHCSNYPRTEGEYVDLCSKDPVIVPCGRISFELSFFDYGQFVISAILIFVIYVAWIHSRREE